MDAALTLNLLIQRDDGLAVDGRRVAQFLIEWCLIVESCCQSEGHILVPRRYSGQRYAGRHDGLLVIAPVGHAHTVVQRQIPRFLALGLQPIGVLQVALDACGAHLVLRGQRVDHIQAVARMGYRVAARVAHLVFASLLLYLLPLDGRASLPVVAPRLVVGYQFHALHVGCQIVAGVLHIGAHTQLLLRLCVVQPVLSLNVVGLLFLGVEGRVEQADFAVLREVARQSGSAK